MKTINVLHITAHLGGGIGKALCGLVSRSSVDPRIKHSIVCLEKPEKAQFLEKIVAHGCEVVVAPSHGHFVELIQHADIVQLEWWGHPASIAALCGGPLPRMRLLVWNHISGLHTPIIPRRLMESAHRCIFTTPCSYGTEEVLQLSSMSRSQLDVVHSAGGFEGLDLPERRTDESLVAGYLGSLNFAKLHPRYVEFLAAVRIPGFRVRMIGDITNRSTLEKQCSQAGRPGMLEFSGYTTDVASELASINVMPYILNPRHYGTSENALLEAMAMAVVPVVFNNPAESCLVTHGKTGLIVKNPEELGAAIESLANNPGERRRIALDAAKAVRCCFAVEKMIDAFNIHYHTLQTLEKASIPFGEIFGRTPDEWFLAIQRHPEIFTNGKHLGTMDKYSLPGLFERTKGSVFHYYSYFSENHQLKIWVDKLKHFETNGDIQYNV